MGVEIMENRSTGLMTLGQIGLGSIAGVILVSVGYLFTNNLFLQVIIADRIHHGFWIGLFTLAAFLLTYGLGVVGVAYGVKWVAQQFGQDCNLRHVWQGAFLGPPTLQTNKKKRKTTIKKGEKKKERQKNKEEFKEKTKKENRK